LTRQSEATSNSRKKKLENVIKAYYDISDDAIKNYFESCGITADDIDDSINHLLSKRKHVAHKRKLQHEADQEVYLNWLLRP
jgi:hypothetical protein